MIDILFVVYLTLTLIQGLWIFWWRHRRWKHNASIYYWTLASHPCQFGNWTSNHCSQWLWIWYLYCKLSCLSPRTLLQSWPMQTTSRVHQQIQQKKNQFWDFCCVSRLPSGMLYLIFIDILLTVYRDAVSALKHMNTIQIMKDALHANQSWNSLRI